MMSVTETILFRLWLSVVSVFCGVLIKHTYMCYNKEQVVLIEKKNSVKNIQKGVDQ